MYFTDAFIQKLSKLVVHPFFCIYVLGHRQINVIYYHLFLNKLISE